MSREKLITFGRAHLPVDYHKGFYHEQDIEGALIGIRYSDFFDDCDEDMLCDSANLLLRGSCNYFAVALQRVFGYNPYVIEGVNYGTFHAFCQLYKGGRWFYIDARGITSSFDEFMTVAREFVNDEYIIYSATNEVIKNWEEDCNFNEKAYAFAEAIIRKYRNYYTL